MPLEIELEVEYFRFGIFLVSLLIFAVFESIFPRRKRNISKLKRWWTNLGMTATYSIILRLTYPSVLVAFTLYVGQNELGLFNNANLPITLEIILALTILDLAIYFQHVLFHKVPVLWRLHKVHHTDMDLDTTSGIRFHPLEIFTSIFYKCFWILILGPSVGSIIIFEIMLNSLSLFNHANIFIPLKLDKVIRWFIVTPEMHRIHHSTLRYEHDSNYGFNLSIWDRLIGTYTEKASLPQTEMNIGLKEYRDPKTTATLKGVLLMPFYRK